MPNIIARAVGAGARAVRFLVTVILLVSVALNFANIVGRYFLNSPIDWAEEVMLFLMVAIVFLGAVAVSWEGRHIKMDIVIGLLPARLRQAFELLAALAEIAVAVTIAVMGMPVIERLAAFDQRSQAANMPLAVPQAAIPIGLLLIAIVTLARCALLLARPPRSEPQEALSASIEALSAEPGANLSPNGG